jgi:hypothetical protein
MDPGSSEVKQPQRHFGGNLLLKRRFPQANSRKPDLYGNSEMRMAGRALLIVVSLKAQGKLFFD